MKVTKYAENNDYSASIKAWFDLYIEKWGLHLTDLRIIQNKNGHRFVGFPSKCYESRGEKKFRPYAYFDKETQERFQTAALNAVEEYKNQPKSWEEPGE